MGKLYRVVSNESVEDYGVKVGDICSLQKDNKDGTSWFNNYNWDNDGTWCLDWSMVEEITEGKLMSVKMVEITEEDFDRLQERDDFLSALECAGVDNWDGFNEAHEILREWREDSDLEDRLKETEI